MGIVRWAIIQRLKQMRKSRNWLAEQTGLRTATTYDYLSGKRQMRTDKLEAMLGVLGLEVRPKE